MMLSAVQYLPLAAGIMLSPMPIIAMLVLSVTGRARGGGTAFLMGWILSIVTFMAFAVLFLQRMRERNPNEVSLIAIILQIVFAFLFFWIAWNNWANRPRIKINIPPPHWIESFSKYSQIRLFWTGGLMNYANIKNIPIMITAGLEISRSAESVNAGMSHALLFAIIASTGMIVPWLTGILGGKRTNTAVQHVRDWLYKYNNIIMGVLFFYMGIMLLSTAITNIALKYGQTG